MPSLPGAPGSAAVATGVVLTIVAAPLVAYGMNGRRRPALLLSAILLITANTTFAGGALATLEW